MNRFAKIWSFRWALRSLPQTLWFNFHYLPFRQAVRLPILLYKPHLYSTKGSIRIEGRVRPGMIVMGALSIGIYPNDGFIYENKGGEIVFQGSCRISNHSALSIGEKGKMVFGDHVHCNAVKMIAYGSIIVGHDSLIGWDTIVTDTDFHSIVAHDDQGEFSVLNPPSAIVIGNHCWIGMRCSLLKGSCIPSHSVVAAGSLLNKDYGSSTNLLLGGTPARILKHNISWRDNPPGLI